MNLLGISGNARAFCFIVVFAAVGLGGCGTAPKVESSPESLVSKRAEERWQAMIKADLDGAYSYLSPGSKSANPLKLFKSKIRLMDWRGATVVSVNCAAEKCSAKLRIAVNIGPKRGGVVETVLEEIWIKDQGEWWLVFN